MGFQIDKSADWYNYCACPIVYIRITSLTCSRRFCIVFYILSIILSRSGLFLKIFTAKASLCSLWRLFCFPQRVAHSYEQNKYPNSIFACSTCCFFAAFVAIIRVMISSYGEDGSHAGYSFTKGTLKVGSEVCSIFITAILTLF
jgi:hypothetical protein